MTQFELSYYVCTPATIILAVISVAVAFKIIKVFYVDSVLPYNVPSVAIVLSCLPEKRMNLCIMTTVLMGLAAFTFFSLVCLLCFFKDAVLVECIAASTGLSFAFLIFYVHSMKKYEVESVQIIKEGRREKGWYV